MDIKTFSDLAKLADICRKKGIKQLRITQEGLEFQLGEKPIKPLKVIKGSESEQAEPLDGDNLLFWSSTGVV